MSALREPGESTRASALLLRERQPRSPVAVEDMPALAHALAALGEGKPRGLKRLRAKLLRSALRWSRRLGLSAQGQLALLMPDGPRRFAGDFNNTALIQYARQIAHGGYEPAVTALIDALAPRLREVHDIGANWGYYVALLATNPAFGGRVDAFEIAPGTFRQLAAMVEACGLQDRVTCHAIGLSDRAGTLGIAEGLHSALTHVVPPGSGREARVTRLDDLGVADPDLVKIDVEGHEAAVLRGGAVRLARAKPVVVLESWYLESEVERMLEPLRSLGDLGYGLYRLAWREEAGGASSFRWSPDRAGPATLALLPLPLEERPLIPTALDVVAVHPDRWSLLTGF